MERRLYRSRRERVIAGVCGGIAEQMQVDPTLVRVAAVALTLLTQGGLVIAYIIMAIVVPEEPLLADTAGAPTAQQAAGFTDTEMIMSDNSTPSSDQVPAAPAAPEAPPSAPEVPPVAPVTYTAPPVSTPQGVQGRRGGVGFGLVLVVVGLALLANQFVPDFDVWRYWPVAVILLGIATILKGLSR